MTTLSPVELARRVELVLARPGATRRDLEQLCAAARAQGSHAVCVCGSQVELACLLLEDSEVKVTGLVGFPFGASDADAKRYETEVAIDTRIITRKGAERVIRYAFELARGRSRGAPGDGGKRLTCVDKSNVLEGCRFLRETFDRVGAQYPDVERDYAYVDAFTQWLVRNPERYNVVVTTNLMGDIITDLAAVLQGGMGFAAGGNIGTDHGMFEPVHGSAPKYAGKDQVNPFATFLAVEQMLRWIAGRHQDARLAEQADRLERAVASVLASGTARTYDQGGTATTRMAGDRLAEAVRAERR